MSKVLVIGGGAAGMMAAGTAAQAGCEVTLLEKKRKLGSKLLLSGKGRCNVTNAGDIQYFMANFNKDGRFLYSAFGRFFNEELRQFLARYGVETKVERGGRVFPVSDDSSEVVRALTRYLKEFGVQIEYNETVTHLKTANGKIQGASDEAGRSWDAGAVIVATGGASYPGTGSTGDGQRMASEVGHTVYPLRPALVPMKCAETWVGEVQGLTLKNVEARLYLGSQLLGKEFGEMVFTHFGVSGPIILSLSRSLPRDGSKLGSISLMVDLKPALTPEQVDARLQRDFDKYSRKQFKNSLDELLPQSMIPVIVRLSGISPDKAVNQITKAERERLGYLLKHLVLTITDTLPLSAAIVTAGGVAVTEIDPRTMESKLVKGLYFAGEIIDVDANTGGFNLQAAFSTGYLAGLSAAQAVGGKNTGRKWS